MPTFITSESGAFLLSEDNRFLIINEAIALEAVKKIFAILPRVAELEILPRTTELEIKPREIEFVLRGG